ncbi:MAG: branched-chain amino acid ABC transporter permease [Dehalococcoidia bacterium]|jgi:branched-chain amino acid transport system permease protein
MDMTTFTSKKFLTLGVALLVVLAALAALPAYGSSYIVVLMTAILMYVLITVSWVIFSGPTGYMSLASAAFFGVGIYTAAVVGDALPLPLVIILGGAVSFVLALLVGALTLRLRGIYFAIFTFGLVLLVQRFLLWFEMTVTHTRGRFVVLVDDATIYYIMLAIFVATMLTAFFIRRSKWGLALQSIGENEEAAAHSGVNVTLVKVFVFAITAVFMGAAGAIMATKWTYIDPYIAFNVLISFMPVLMAIFGGLGQFYGPVVGAAIFAYLQEYLKTTFPYQYMLIFGAVLVLVIVFLPNGLAGIIQWLMRRWRKGGSEVQNADT